MLIRGHQAINVNGVEIDTAMTDSRHGQHWDHRANVGGRAHGTFACTVPRKALRAYYDHLRTSPRGGTTPALDSAREYNPKVQAGDPGDNSRRGDRPRRLPLTDKGR